MEIPNASLAMVKTGQDGRQYTIETDVLDIVKQIKEIDPRLNVKYNELAGYFVITEMCLDGVERRVTTTTALDQRVLEHLRKIGSDSWDVGRELDRADARFKATKDDEFNETMGENAEHLAHALRKDLGVQNRIVVPGGINGHQ